jgi:hypothetical protein
MQTPKKSAFTANIRLTVVLVSVFVIGLFYWLYRYYYSNSTRVFYGMVANNLNTQNYVDISDQEGISGNLLIETEVNSGSNNIVISKETTKLTSSNDLIQTLSIGTPSTDYSSYQKIDIGKSSFRYSKLLDTWGINSPNGVSGQGGQLYKSTIFTPFLFASPSASDTSKLVSFIKLHKVYIVKSTKTAKSGDRQIINYQIGVNLKQYSSLLAMYSTMIGYRNHNETSSYSGDQIADLNISVDVLSRRLVGLSYVGSNSVQAYQSYGIESSIKLPTKTIALQELKNEISALSNK